MNIQNKLSNLPADPGVYIMKDASGAVIYVGKAKSLKHRVRSYWQDPDSPKTQQLVKKIYDFEVIATPTEWDALILENNLIKKYQPYYNLRLKDDKRYPYLKLTVNEEYPRLMIVRKYVNDGARYFGPYTGRNIILYALRELRTVFKLRQCVYPDKKLPRKTCLQFQIKRCLGPCEFPEVRAEYQKACQDLILFLEGKHDALLKSMTQEMQQASDQQQYEKAAAMRDRIEKIRALFQRQEMVLEDESDQDLVMFFTHGALFGLDVLQVRSGKVLANEVVFFSGPGVDEDIHERQLIDYYERRSVFPQRIIVDRPLSEFPLLREWFKKDKNIDIVLRCEPKHDLFGMVRRNIELAKLKHGALIVEDKALNELQDVLKLDNLPRYIEAYDISNTGGTNIIGSKVVFKDGKPWKTAYRRFNIKTVSGDPNDFASMEEMLTRRCQRLLEASGAEVDDPELPRLFLIDGGKGHLAVAEKVLKKMNITIPAISIAKEHEDIFYHEKVVDLPKDSAAQKLLQRLRDEAHRFGITAHRAKRSKTSLSSELDSIPGIGPAMRKKLLNAFESVAGIKKAGRGELQKSLGAKTAETVYNYFHGGTPA